MLFECDSALPKTTEAQVLGKQVLRSGTSVGANYREAFRGRSRAECGDSLRKDGSELQCHIEGEVQNSEGVVLIKTRNIRPLVHEHFAGSESHDFH